MRDARQRLDLALVQRGLLPTRARARAAIEAGLIYLNGECLRKPAALVETDAALELRGAPMAFVSRGALKLEAALDRFGFDPSGRVCLDIGASTGGFTDLLLQRAAAKVYAVDVGHDQLDAKLRADSRVISLEGVNARHLSATEIPEAPEALVCDASFIGLETILPAPLGLLAPGAFAVALIKPQFEAGPRAVGKRGVVKDEAVQRAVCARIEAWWRGLAGWKVSGMIESPILGPEGNREFLIGAEFDA